MTPSSNIVQIQYHLVDRNEEGDELVDVFESECEARSAAKDLNTIVNPLIYPSYRKLAK